MLSPPAVYSLLQPVDLGDPEQVLRQEWSNGVSEAKKNGANKDVLVLAVPLQNIPATSEALGDLLAERKKDSLNAAFHIVYVQKLCKATRFSLFFPTNTLVK